MTLRVPAGFALSLTPALALSVFFSQDPLTFHGYTDLVFVAVSVKDGRVPVGGLTSNDFTLLDNGVSQSIEAVTVDAVPIDVSVVIDVSDSVFGSVGAFKGDARRLAAMLRPIDRVRLVSFSSGIVETTPMQPAGQTLSFNREPSGTGSAVNDAVLYGVLWPAPPGRRHLVIALTDGRDNVSTVSSDALAALIGRLDVVVHLVLVAGVRSSGQLKVWEDHSRAMLTDAATRTGGAVHDGYSSTDDFRQILDDFHASYVLRFTPKGVTRTGWHDLAVTVRKAGGERFTVRARQGYVGG